MLLRAMPCPVLTVGPQDKMDAFDETHTTRIMVTTDFAATSKAALEYAEHLAVCLNGKLYILHVEDRTSTSHVMNPSEQKAQFAVFTAGMKEPSRIAEYITYIGDPLQRIVQAARDKCVDFLVMRVHESDQPGGGRVHGVVYDVIRQRRCPVFSLRMPAGKRQSMSEAAPTSLVGAANCS